MMGNLSNLAPVLDISADAFRAAAGDLGEVVAVLAGGLKPDAETLSRLCLSLRMLQGFLIREAEQQAHREAIGRAIGIPVRDGITLDFSAPPPFRLRRVTEELA